MPNASVTILGGGNTAFATAASLTLRGFEVTLFEIEGFEASLDPVSRSGIIHLLGEYGQGPAKIRCLTTDIEEALAAAEMVLLIVPAYAHKPFAEVCAPHLNSRHTVVVMPGTLGALEWSQIFAPPGSSPGHPGRGGHRPLCLPQDVARHGHHLGRGERPGAGRAAGFGNRQGPGGAGAALPRYADLSRCDGLRPGRHESGGPSRRSASQRREGGILQGGLLLL